MNKEEFDINQELEQMRQDYAALKEGLDKQQIVSDNLLQAAMKSDIRRLFLTKDTIIWTVILDIALISLCFIQSFYWWLPAALALFGVIFVPGALWVYKGIREEDVYNGDVLTTTKALQRFKKRYIAWETGVCVYFIAFAAFAFFHTTSMPISGAMMLKRGILGAVLAVAVLAYEYYSAKRILRSCDAIIERLRLKDAAY